ncbi:hypothetical protein [Thioclava sp. DLFJ5-1]|uniref:hypothetical protein n=1 Tax=Thioclava sp. DLFJ5-1 TaxID=1915314 RepID=UPI00117CB0D9|nr:hypothetical protein [Thioclava sp. DLFJ5-1]
MRAYTEKHSNARFVEDYIFREGAEFIGGTLIFTTKRAARLQLEELAAGQEILHTTLSLPEGLHMARQEWLQVVFIQLELMGLPPLEIPSLIGRHADANCDHVHFAHIPTTFVGTLIKPRLSRRDTDRNHVQLAKRLGLPAPIYFDPKTPTLRPPTPRRKLNSPARMALYRAMTEIFENDPPTSIEGLKARLRSRSEPITLMDARNSHGIYSYRYRTAHGEVWGGELGEAWQPRHLHTRFDLAMALPASSLALSIRHSKDKMKEAIHAAHTECAKCNLAIARSRIHHQGNRRENRRADAADRIAPTVGERQDRARETDDVGALRPAGRTHDARAHSTGHEGLSGFDHRGSAGPRRTLERPRDTRARERGRPETHLATPEHPGALSFGSWLARTLNILRQNFQDWRWKRLPKRLAIVVAFSAGDQAIISPREVQVLREGPDAALLFQILERRQFEPVVATDPQPDTQPLPPADECGPDF